VSSDATVIIFINCAVSSQCGVIIARFKIVLQHFKAALQINFSFNDVEKCELNVVGQNIEATNTGGGAVKCNVSEDIVFTGQ